MSLEETAYSVLEDVGVIEVCVIVDKEDNNCTLSLPIILSLSTHDNSAGIYRNDRQTPPMLPVPQV